MAVFHDTEGKALAKKGALNVSNEMIKVRDSFTSIDTSLWDVTIDTGDSIEVAGNTQGSGYLKVSKALDQDDTDTIFLSKFTVTSPVRMALGMSLSQRLAGQHFSFGLVGVDKAGNVEADMPKATPIALSTIAQTTTTLTVVTTEPHNLVPNDRIEIYDVADSRANYGELMVATIVSPTSFTVTATPSATLPSVTIATVSNSGFVRRVDPLKGANNALAVFWEGISANMAKIVSRAGKSSISNTVDTTLGTNHTNGVQGITAAFADAWNPAFMYDMRYKAESVVVRTMPMDSIAAQGGVLKRSQVIPDLDFGYKIRIKASNNRAMTKPVAKIVNVAKSGSTTATITTDVPHGLTVTDYIQVYGVRDQTNFPNVTTPTAVASVVNATTLTIVIGSSATISSKGGTVIKVNGGKLIAPNAISVQSINVTGGQMTVIGSGTWAGLLPGETVELRGLVDNTTGEVYTQYEGVFKVLSTSTTTLILQVPFTDTGTILCGGTVFKRTDFRLHLFRALDYTRHTVEIDGSVGNVSDQQEALPVTIPAGTTISSGTVTTLSNGQTAHDSPVTGSPFRMGNVARTTLTPVSLTGDAVDAPATMLGIPIMRPYTIPELEWTYAGAGAVINTTDVALKALLAGNRQYLTSVQMQNTHATVGTEVVIKDGATVIWRGFAPANMQALHEINFNIPLKTSVGAALNFACVTTGANVYVNAQGFTAP